MSVEPRPRSQIVQDYIDAAGVRDSALLIERDWLDRALVRVIKMHTELATMRVTVYWISAGRANVEDVKLHCASWLYLRYNVDAFDFRQSLIEQRASTPLATYFHCICNIPDALAIKKLR